MLKSSVRKISILEKFITPGRPHVRHWGNHLGLGLVRRLVGELNEHGVPEAATPLAILKLVHCQGRPVERVRGGAKGRWRGGSSASFHSLGIVMCRPCRNYRKGKRREHHISCRSSHRSPGYSSTPAGDFGTQRHASLMIGNSLSVPAASARCCCCCSSSVDRACSTPFSWSGWLAGWLTVHRHPLLPIGAPASQRQGDPHLPSRLQLPITRTIHPALYMPAAATSTSTLTSTSIAAAAAVAAAYIRPVA